MIVRNIQIFELNKKTNDPRFEGFALDRVPSVMGNEFLFEDLTPGLDADENSEWQHHELAGIWKAPTTGGRVSEFNDYPCVDMVYPAFSDRAIDALGDLLKPNGEILPLKTNTKTDYFVYNVLSISDSLNRESSDCDFWCDPPTTANRIDFFSFDEKKVRRHAIFRLRELPMNLYVNQDFVERVEAAELQGFDFTKVWPFPKGTDWRKHAKAKGSKSQNLKTNTLVLVFNTIDVENFLPRIQNFEREIDSNLQIATLEAEYFGCYEGHDQIEDEYRMFFSCPDADRLLKRLEPQVKKLKWPHKTKAFCRNGQIHQKDVDEKLTTI